MERLLPQNIEAECGVLGSLIIDPQAIAQVADWLRSDDFYRDAHQTIYKAIMALYERHQPAELTWTPPSSCSTATVLVPLSSLQTSQAKIQWMT